MEIPSLLSYRSPNTSERFVETSLPYDYQAIPFISSTEQRHRFRTRRNQNYRSFRNEVFPLDQESARFRAPMESFAFAACYAKAPCKSEHFQLKHCLQVSPNNEIYVTGPSSGEISLFDTVTRDSKLVLKLAGQEFTKITTFAVQDKLLATGGIKGELYLDSLYGDEVHIRKSLAPNDDHNITNSIKFVNLRGAVELMIGSNNKSVVFFDVNRLDSPTRERSFQTNVNCVALSSDASLIATAGDEINCHVMSSASLQPVFELAGHRDHNFCVAWHPTKPYLLATGGQDQSARVWDIRVVGGDTCKPLVTLFGELAAVLNVQFSPDGEMMLWGESIDYLHLTESRLFEEEQIVDFFGEVSGVGMSQESPTPASVYVGISDSHYPAILELRRKPHPWTDSFLV